MVALGAYIESPLELPYIDKDVDLKGRTIHLLPYYDASASEWFAFFPGKGKKLQRVALVDVIRGGYLSSKPLEESTDLSLPLHDLVFQRMSFPGMGRPIMGLEDAVENATSTLEFYEIVSKLHQEAHPGASQMAQSLLNQLFVVSRSLYDTLQVVCKVVCSFAMRIEDPSKAMMNNLPTSFAEVALHADQPRTAEEISARYNMPPPLAGFYSSQAPFLADIRKIRDRIIHRGHHAGFVMNLDEGLAISTNDVPWRDFPIWEGAIIGENGLGSLRRLFAHIIMTSVAATTRFAEAFFSCVALPAPLSPGNRAYLRGPLNHHLLTLEHTLEFPWERKG